MFDKAIEGLIAAGPLAVCLGIALRWAVTKMEDAVKENKQLTVDLEKSNQKIQDAKDNCTIELLKAKDQASAEKIALYERVMKVFEHMGGNSSGGNA